MRNHNLMFAPGSREEESMMLMGRIEAAAAYIRGSQYIEREIIADMLGVDLEPANEAEPGYLPGDGKRPDKDDYRELKGVVMYYKGMTGTPEEGHVVEEDQAYDYALERCLKGTEEDQRDFREMLVEWFYSGNWIEGEDDAETDF